MISIAATRRSASTLLAANAKHLKTKSVGHNGGGGAAPAGIRLVSSMPSSSPLKDEDSANSSNMARRGLVSKASPHVEASIMMAEAFAVEQQPTSISSSSSAIAKTSPLMDRFTTTFEVTVSKIFPAGFGWQTSSVLATSSYLGFGTETLNFALTTGLGDAIGVLGGHTVYYAAKKAFMPGNEAIDMEKELHTGILLGTAAFCSGTAWQPIVNALQGAQLPFAQVFLGTWLGCGAAFYAGLRVGRTMLSDALQHVHEPTYENSKRDLALSASIGGATGFFVGTDTAYLPSQNFLIDVVGIQPGTSNLMGAAIAGSSTSLGFVSAQSAMNMTYPKGKCWNDQESRRFPT